MAVESEHHQPEDGLGQVVRRRRVGLRLTQKQAARRAGVSLATWQSIERTTDDASSFTELTLSRIASGLRLPAENLFNAAGRPPPPPVEVQHERAHDQLDTNEVDELIDGVTEDLRSLAATSEDDLRWVVTVVRGLCERLIRIDRG